MAETKIEWCDYTFNHVRGCTKISPGCTNCYADTMSSRNPKTLGVWGPNGTRVVAAEAYWREPVKWNRDAKIVGKRRRVFCASLADVFEDWPGRIQNAQGHDVWVSQRGTRSWDSDDGSERDFAYDRKPLTMQDVRDRLFRLIDDTPHLDWLLLSKRPENMLRMTYDAWCKKVPGHVSQNEGDGRKWAWPGNVWAGVSVEDQARADERIPLLLQTPAAVRFLSVEPLLGPVDLSKWLGNPVVTGHPAWRNDPDRPPVAEPMLHWLIVGGESGPGARPCHVNWVRSIVKQCRNAGVACFVKQMGSAPTSGNGSQGGLIDLTIRNIRDKKGGDIEEFPEDLRVREWPVAPAGK